MNEGFEGFSRRHKEGLISAISAGFFLILIGALFIITPNLFERITDFFRDFDVVRVPNIGLEIYLPAPTRPLTHRVVFVAVERFSFVWGLFQIVILATRLVVRSPVRKDAETVSNIVFWFGTSFLTRTFLIERIRLPLLTDIQRWFVFWAGIVTLIGVSLIIRAIILAASSMRRVT